ncbi:hypothetical protein Tsp_01185 [Trichinella spiralis]|uniref:hypothetical protein n=1 Tax=Trichinella spiralis TaxID=6334 RepID=UPI0001EFC66A|nr:hypothetical protein Tsp_01185 [Trichinella spiralis]
MRISEEFNGNLSKQHFPAFQRHSYLAASPVTKRDCQPRVNATFISVVECTAEMQLSCIPEHVQLNFNAFLFTFEMYCKPIQSVKERQVYQFKMLYCTVLYNEVKL